MRELGSGDETAAPRDVRPEKGRKIGPETRCDCPDGFSRSSTHGCRTRRRGTRPEYASQGPDAVERHWIPFLLRAPHAACSACVESANLMRHVDGRPGDTLDSPYIRHRLREAREEARLLFVPRPEPSRVQPRQRALLHAPVDAARERGSPCSVRILSSLGKAGIMRAGLDREYCNPGDKSRLTCSCTSM